MELLGGEGEVLLEDPGDRDAAVIGLPLTDLDLIQATSLEVSDGDTVWLRTEDGPLVGLTEEHVSETVDWVDGVPTTTYQIRGSDGGRIVTSSHYGLLEYDRDEGAMANRTPELLPEHALAAHAWTPDGQLLIGGSFDLSPWLDTVDLDGPLVDDLSQYGGPSQGTIGQITVLEDGAVATVVRTLAGYELWMTDTEGTEPSPVGGDRGTANRRYIERLDALPDGRLLVTTDLHVEAVDPDSGDVEVLYELAGATGPRAAVATDDHLYLLAGGRLWRDEI